MRQPNRSQDPAPQPSAQPQPSAPQPSQPSQSSQPSAQPPKISLHERLNAALERYFYHPGLLASALAFLLLPLSLLYAAIALFNAYFARSFKPPLYAISVGNLTLGGSNKSPFVRALAKHCASEEFARAAGLSQPLLPQQIAIILRGYKRQSSELAVCDFLDSERFGDEACEHKMLSSAQVIVSANRAQALQKAADLGCKIAILDDAFGKFFIKKFDFLLEHEKPSYWPFCLPAGPLRLPRFVRKRAHFIARANVDYFAHSTLPQRLDECFLLTAIARPQRLEHIRRQCAGSMQLADHAQFCESEIAARMRACGATRLLCTGKDYVKLRTLAPIAQIIALEITLSERAKSALGLHAARYF